MNYFGFGFTHAFLDTLEVGIEIERPLVQLTRGDLDETHSVYRPFTCTTRKFLLAYVRSYLMCRTRLKKTREVKMRRARH